MPEAAPLRDQRRRDFGGVVRRALDNARMRGLTIRQIEEVTGIGSTTFYGWRDGRWVRDPVASLVNAFCDGLGVPRGDAYRALRWEEPGGRREPSPLIEDPDVRKLMRVLTDPRRSAAEKLLIRRWINSLDPDTGDRDTE